MLIEYSHLFVGYNWTAPANGTTLVPLNLASDCCLAQLNFNYTDSDGNPQIILSPYFDIDNSSQSRAVTWSQGVLAALTPYPSANPQTSILASLLTSSASTASVAPSSPSISQSTTTSDSHLGTGPIVGIAGGILACVGFAAALVFYRRCKPNKIQAEVTKPSSAEIQPPIPVDLIAEKDATPLQPAELSGDGLPVEMATDSHGEMNGSMGRA